MDVIVSANYDLMSLTTCFVTFIGQLFRVNPEGVRCYEYNDTYTVSCEVYRNSSKLISQVSFLCHFIPVILDRSKQIGGSYREGLNRVIIFLPYYSANV